MIDISVPLAATTPPWPGDRPFSCGWTCRRDDGESVNLAAVTTSVHVGTHADAPLHVESGWPASEALAVDAFVGPCTVIALPETHVVTEDISIDLLRTMLGDAVRPARLLLRTGRTVALGHFPGAWPTLSPEAAEWLVQRGLRLWGMDAPSVDRRESKTLPVHHALLGRGAFVLENLDLRAVFPGHYELMAAPVAITGADAAPVRALLR